MQRESPIFIYRYTHMVMISCIPDTTPVVETCMYERDLHIQKRPAYSKETYIYMISCIPDTTPVVAVSVVIDFEELPILEFIYVHHIHICTSYLGYLSLCRICRSVSYV